MSMLTAFAQRIAPRWERVAAAPQGDSGLIRYNLFTLDGVPVTCADHFTVQAARSSAKRWCSSRSHFCLRLISNGNPEVDGLVRAFGCVPSSSSSTKEAGPTGQMALDEGDGWGARIRT